MSELLDANLETKNTYAFLFEKKHYYRYIMEKPVDANEKRWNKITRDGICFNKWSAAIAFDPTSIMISGGCNEETELVFAQVYTISTMDSRIQK